MNEYQLRQHNRFRGLTWYPMKSSEMVIGGVGGIGSNFALAAARAGAYRLYLYDDDIVEPENLAGQAYDSRHINMKKVDAMNDIIKDYNGTSVIVPMNQLYTTETGLTSSSMFSCFDNMAARKVMFEKWLNDKDNYRNPIFVDGRLEAQTFQTYYVVNDEELIEKYRATLVDDSQVPDLACSMKQTSHVAQMIAGIMFATYTNFLTNLRFEANICEVPYNINFEVPNMNFTKTY